MAVMPFIEIQTRTAPPNAETVLQKVSRLVAHHFDKPEAYVMTSWTQAPMTFAGSSEPCCWVHVQLIGVPSADAMARLNEELCALIERSAAVPKERIFVVFTEVRRDHWGKGGAMLG